MLRRTIKFPNSSAGLRCACCKTDQCSFVKDNGYQKAPLQHWLNENSADSNVSSPRQPTVADGSPVPPNSAGRPIKFVIKTPMTHQSLVSSARLGSESGSESSSESDSSSTLSTAPSDLTNSNARSPPAATTKGEGLHLKRSRSNGESLNDGTPSAKAARLDANAATAATSTTEELANQFQGKDHEFGRHILGLLGRHESILKTKGTAQAAVEDLKQDLSRERKEKEAMRSQQLELDKKRGEERTAESLMAKENEAESIQLKKERDTARSALADTQSKLEEVLRREANVLEREKEARQVTKGLEDRLAEEETQHNLAVKNADASRHARNETQHALEVIQADNNRLTQELKTMTANHENVTIDLEETQASLKRAEADSAQLIDVKAELVTVRSELQRLSSANAQLSASAEAIEDLEKKLETMRNVAQDNLDDKNQIEARLHDARAEAVEWKQKGEEHRKNLNVAVGNLLKSEMNLKELKRERNGDGQGGGSRVKREVIDMTEA